MTYGPEKRYGKALFELAEEQKQLKPLIQEAESMIEELAKDAEIIAFLEDPMLSHKQKSEVVNTFMKKAKASDLMRKFASLMVVKGRGDILLNALKCFQEYYMEAEGVVSAKVVSAFPMAAKHKGEIEAFVKKTVKGSKKVELEEEVNEKLIGGFKVLVGSQEFDASLSGSLSQIKTSLKSF